MLIDLESIDENGKNFKFDELSDELLGAFKDLISDTPFSIELDIKPLGNTYHAQGRVTSSYPEDCSRCGYDVELPLDYKINEIIVIEKERPRNTQVSQSRQNFDLGTPAVTYINSVTFDLKEFLHEMMASGFDLYPKCTDEALCESRQHPDVVLEPTASERPGHPGFAALKNLKIDSLKGS